MNLTNSTPAVAVVNTLQTLPLFNNAISYVTVASAFASFLAVGGSIGGGGMQVCIYLLFFDFSASSATTLSRTVVFGVVLVTYFFSWRSRHPSAPRPLIDYDIALLMGPTSVLGSTYGTMINVVFSDYIIFICMILVLLFSVYKTLQKGLQLRKRELATIKKALDDAGHDNESKEDEFSNTPDSKQNSLDTNSSASEKTDFTLDLDSMTSMDESARTEKESRQFPLDRYFLVLLSIAGIALSSIFAGGRTVSIIGVACGSWSYYLILFGCTIPYLCGISGYVAWTIFKKEKEKMEIGYPYHPQEMKWTVVFCGKSRSDLRLCAGAFGIGGGLIQGPLMLALGVGPVLMNTTATLIQAFVTNTLPWDWAIWFMGFSFWGSFFGRALLEKLVKIYKKQSLIVFLLAFLVVVTTGALVYSFSRRITSNTATWSFKPLCAATPAPPFVNVNVTEK